MSRQSGNHTIVLDISQQSDSRLVITNVSDTVDTPIVTSFWMLQKCVTKGKFGYEKMLPLVIA